jgi:RimJ/RimL family protein N-acetyltransferase
MNFVRKDRYDENRIAGAMSRKEKTMALEGRCLKALSHEDLTKIKEWRNSQIEFLRQWKPLTDQNQEEWFHRISKDESQAVFAIKAVIDGKQELIGYCALVRIDTINRRAELSFLVDPSRAQDTVLYEKDMRCSLALLCAYGFDQIALHKIFTETFEFRKEHMSILEDFGFRKEGSMRDHQWKKGRFWDSILHSMLEQEWREIRSKWF